MRRFPSYETLKPREGRLRGSSLLYTPDEDQDQRGPEQNKKTRRDPKAWSLDAVRELQTIEDEMGDEPTLSAVIAASSLRGPNREAPSGKKREKKRDSDPVLTSDQAKGAEDAATALDTPKVPDPTAATKTKSELPVTVKPTSVKGTADKKEEEGAASVAAEAAAKKKENKAASLNAANKKEAVEGDESDDDYHDANESDHDLKAANKADERAAKIEKKAAAKKKEKKAAAAEKKKEKDAPNLNVSKQARRQASKNKPGNSINSKTLKDRRLREKILDEHIAETIRNKNREASLELMRLNEEKQRQAADKARQKKKSKSEAIQAEATQAKAIQVEAAEMQGSGTKSRRRNRRKVNLNRGEGIASATKTNEENAATPKQQADAEEVAKLSASVASADNQQALAVTEADKTQAEEAGGTHSEVKRHGIS